VHYVTSAERTFSSLVDPCGAGAVLQTLAPNINIEAFVQTE